LHLQTLLLFAVGDTKTIRPLALKGHGSIAHSPSPHGLSTLIVNYPFFGGGGGGEGEGAIFREQGYLVNHQVPRRTGA